MTEPGDLDTRWPYSEPSSIDLLLSRLDDLARQIEQRRAAVGDDSTKQWLDALEREVQAEEAARKAREETARLEAEAAARAADNK